MTDNVTKMTGLTTAKDTIENILEKAKDWGMKDCLVMGVDENDDLMFGGNTSETADIYWILTRVRLFIEQFEFERDI